MPRFLIEAPPIMGCGASQANATGFEDIGGVSGSGGGGYKRSAHSKRRNSEEFKFIEHRDDDQDNMKGSTPTTLASTSSAASRSTSRGTEQTGISIIGRKHNNNNNAADNNEASSSAGNATAAAAHSSVVPSANTSDKASNSNTNRNANKQSSVVSRITTAKTSQTKPPGSYSLPNLRESKAFVKRLPLFTASRRRATTNPVLQEETEILPGHVTPSADKIVDLEQSYDLRTISENPLRTQLSNFKLEDAEIASMSEQSFVVIQKQFIAALETQQDRSKDASDEAITIHEDASRIASVKTKSSQLIPTSQDEVRSVSPIAEIKADNQDDAAAEPSDTADPSDTHSTSQPEDSAKNSSKRQAKDGPRGSSASSKASSHPSGPSSSLGYAGDQESSGIECDTDGETKSGTFTQPNDAIVTFQSTGSFGKGFKEHLRQFSLGRWSPIRNKGTVQIRNSCSDSSVAANTCSTRTIAEKEGSNNNNNTSNNVTTARKQLWKFGSATSKHLFRSRTVDADISGVTRKSESPSPHFERRRSTRSSSRAKSSKSASNGKPRPPSSFSSRLLLHSYSHRRKSPTEHLNSLRAVLNGSVANGVGSGGGKSTSKPSAKDSDAKKELHVNGTLPSGYLDNDNNIGASSDSGFNNELIDESYDWTNVAKVHDDFFNDFEDLFMETELLNNSTRDEPSQPCIFSS